MIMSVILLLSVQSISACLFGCKPTLENLSLGVSGDTFRVQRALNVLRRT